MEPISISAMVVAIITAIGVLLSKVKFKHCLCGCIESDCITTPEPTPEPTPAPSIHITNHTPQSSPETSRKKITTDV
jgi:hypothetical protein